MRRVLAVLLGLTLIMPFSWAAGGAAKKPPRYKAYIVCSAKKSADPATTCDADKPKTAVFLSKDKDVVYKVCVKFPGKKDRLCASHQQAKEGVKSGVSVTATEPGLLKATWFVDGEKVGAWRLDIDG